tara:strand:- start:3947 stop:4567 length:621 start_codon:yes stop_codon:yes gene_type:complete
MADTMDMAEFRDRIQELGEAEFSRRLKVALIKFSADMVDIAKKNARSSPKVRSGRLRGSIRGAVKDNPIRVLLMAGGSVGAGRVAYAGIQEFGGEVKPVAADFLRVPLGPSITSDGDERFGGSLRSYPGEGFFPFEAKSGKLYIGKRGDTIGDGAPRAWYALVDKVTVPRTLFMGRAVQEAVGKLQPELADVMRVSLRFERAKGGT